jgi:hypothetical protein
MVGLICVPVSIESVRQSAKPFTSQPQRRFL